MHPRPSPAHVFTLVADAAPGLLPRVLNPFAKRDVTPDTFAATRNGDACRIDVVCHDLDPVDARHIHADLLRVVGLRALEMTLEPARLVA